MNIRHILLLPGLLLCPLGLSHAQAPAASDESLPRFELDELEVIHSETEFAPVFKGDQPRFVYYELPDLPNGGLILALEFMDRYRDAAIPGSMKWAGILNFPVIDGRERPYAKMICLYLYADRMWGYDPDPVYEYDRRFSVPIQYADRANKDVLFRFATSYVERVFPGGEEEVYFEEAADPDDPYGMTEETYEMITIDPGRIAPIFSSQKGMEPEQLVRLIYHYGEPNPRPIGEVPLGPAEDFGKVNFSWSGFLAELGPRPDPVDLAAELVERRWSQVANFHYDQSFLGLIEWKAKRRVLLFNIGMRIYVYDDDLGVWRSNARLEDLREPATLKDKLNHPEIKGIREVEFLSD